MQYVPFCQVPILVRVPAQCQHLTADQELSIVKMNVWADFFSATRKQWQKTAHWLGRLTPDQAYQCTLWWSLANV
jgi:hypothetical protein